MPALLQDYSFLKALPSGDLLVQGTWANSEIEALHGIARSGAPLPFKPVLGVFTSGTLSSSPRLVLYSKENLSAALEGIFKLFDKSRIEHVFCYPQAFHTFGLTLGYLSSYLNGWTLHTPHGKYQRASHEDRIALREEKVLTLGTPTHFFDLLQIVEESGRELAQSYTCIMGGAGVSRNLWHSVRNGLRIEAPSIGYGCTEASPGISHLPPGVAPTQDDEIGLPLDSIYSVIGPEGVSIEGPSLCPAIIQHGQIEFPRQLNIRDRILRKESGSWIYGGRLDLTLNRGGQKFSLEAIEKLLHDRLNVGVVASTVRDTRLGEDLGLAVVAGHARLHDEIIASAQDLLMREFSLRLAPNRILFLSDFPLNECSKLDRRATRMRLESYENAD
ncbi:MAG: acyl--CoA ligase [Bdellovibrionaceae bacterium]|nr:acyl--CoA ligase [Pseudobdellovibrionaceae bacterium]